MPTTCSQGILLPNYFLSVSFNLLSYAVWVNIFFLFFLIFLYPICHHISGNTAPRNKDKFPWACGRPTTWLPVLWLFISAFAKHKHTNQCYFVGTAHYSIRYNLLTDMSLSALWIFTFFLQQNRSWKLFSSSYFLSFSFIFLYFFFFFLNSHFVTLLL